jgi:ABC-type bacteriocin/lantibiotic exporter with double-glycine peptidase domain
LDNKTQKQVSEALDKLNCTRIVIAHRLSTIRHCNRILILDKDRNADTLAQLLKEHREEAQAQGED